MNHSKLKILGLSILLAGSYSPAQALEGSGLWGLLGLAKATPYAGDATQTRWFPLFFYNSENLYFDGRRLGYILQQHSDWHLDAIASLQTQGYKASSSVVFKGMSDRDPSIDGGLVWHWQQQPWKAEISLSHDLLGHHQGGSLQAKLGHGFQFTRMIVTPSIGIEWQGAKMANYYYGVRPSEATATRPAYQVGRARNTNIGLQALYFAGRDWNLIAQLSHSRYADAIASSPIVDEPKQTTLLFGIGKRF